MTPLEHEKAMLLTRIEANRAAIDLEVTVARERCNPLVSVCSMLGLNRHLAEVVRPLLGVVSDYLRERRGKRAGTTSPQE